MRALFDTTVVHTVCRDMANRLRIRIDWPRLLENLSKQEGRDVPLVEVEQWLTDAGFAREGEDDWIVSEANLGHLDPSEVISVDDV
jgi:hypothetical protein